MLLSVILVRIVGRGRLEINEQTVIKKFFRKMGFKRKACAPVKGFLAVLKPNVQQWLSEEAEVGLLVTLGF